MTNNYLSSTGLSGDCLSITGVMVPMTDGHSWGLFIYSSYVWLWSHNQTLFLFYLDILNLPYIFNYVHIQYVQRDCSSWNGIISSRFSHKDERAFDMSASNKQTLHLICHNCESSERQRHHTAFVWDKRRLWTCLSENCHEQRQRCSYIVREICLF